MKQILETIFTLSLLITLSCVSVNACWCRNDSNETNTKENFRKAISQMVSSSDFVFSGMLVEENNEQLIFRIDNNWKGGAKDKITFRSLHKVINGEREYFISDCEYTFELGKSYLVYAKVSLRGIEVDKCGRTAFLKNAPRDIEELNRQKQISRLLEFNQTSFLLNYKSLINARL